MFLKSCAAAEYALKIENDTFTTLKNQGYNFEQNYEHGKENLSVVFAMLMMLTFLVDRAQQLSCQLFQSVWKKLGSKRSLWDKIRSLFFVFKFDSMENILIAFLYGFKRDYQVLLEDPPPSWWIIETERYSNVTPEMVPISPTSTTQYLLFDDICVQTATLPTLKSAHLSFFIFYMPNMRLKVI